MNDDKGFQVKIVADSVSAAGVRLTTMQLRYPRFIHSELMTHRMFSRNAASSRAIPVAKMIEQVRNDPAMPVFWGKNQSGMQAAEELAGWERANVITAWIDAVKHAADRAEYMEKQGAHKQLVNRLLEPWQWMVTIVTATEWDNFYELRCHPDAQPEFQHLANMMRREHDRVLSHQLEQGEWHLPYVNALEREKLTLEEQVKCSVARCARVSYLNHDGSSPDVVKDIALHDKLVVMKPAHASPAEHQATPDSVDFADGAWVEWGSPNLHGNLRGWRQYRKLLEFSLPINIRKIR